MKSAKLLLVMKNFRQILIKMTVFPSVIFVVGFVLIKSEVLTVSFLDNKAAAASTLGNVHKVERGLDVFAYIQDWRKSKIIRTSLNYDPKMFEDLNVADIEKLFGTPDMVRRDGVARVAQYTYKGCTADFYYLAGGAEIIQHYEIRHTSNATRSSNCLSDLLGNL